ncbi:DUF885 family protein [Mesomycoplasma moatsii]|uniref:DUF885 family protein n=1 Tax=Mesomycoplasma moatsii TaxID=171287 RepID=UPI0003B6B5C2
MTKNIKLIALSSLFSLSSIFLIPPLVTSCSNKNHINNLIALNQEYLDNEKNYIYQNSAGLPIYGAYGIETSLDNLIINSTNAISALNNYQAQNNLNQDENIWLNSYIFQWQNKINNIRSGILFLGANPLKGDRILSTSSNWIRDYLKQGINIYPLNPETGDPDINAIPDKDLVFNLKNKINQTSDIINQYYMIINYGANKYGFMPSSIAKKLLINQLLQTFYLNEIKSFIKSSNDEITIKKLVSTKVENDYFSDLRNTINKLNYLNNEEKNEIFDAIQNLKNSLDKFMIFYSGVYYAHSSSFGKQIASGENNYLKLSKTSNNEIEKTLIVDNQKVYGVGLTNDDLNTEKIGIGFMKLKNLENSIFVKDANDVYQQMLVNNNSINVAADEIYQKGIHLTTQGKNNMDLIAQKAKNIIEGNLSNKIYYDEDGIGPQSARLVNIIGTNDFEKFNMWLNQEDFFFGREVLENNNLDSYINYFWNNPNSDKLKKYKEIITQQGYESYWKDKKTINGDNTGTVSGNEALAGAVSSFLAYQDFKNISDPIYNEMFNNIPDYVLSPYNYTIREDIGVGMEGPRGSNQFQYNCDPYYSLPKWSISSLITHEGKMGHHTQNAYWTKYLKGGEGKNNSGPGYTFVNDSFHEGWAVFSEWYANELEIYGSNLDPITRMPQNFLNAKGSVPKYDSNVEKDHEKLVNLTNEMKLFHNGVYYKNAIGEDNSVEKLKNSIQLANMLQYYGFLNEAQLRNIRLAVDTAFHYNNDNNNVAQENDLPFGASIKQVRDFMKKNSALSIGDINSESIRYMVMPSQATGYMLGKIIFNDLYNAVQNIKGNLNNNSNESKKLFDLMLRNGEIPLEVLKKTINSAYKIY